MKDTTKAAEKLALMKIRPRLGLRHGTPLASRDVPGERGRLSSCIWNLGFFPNDARKN